MNTQKFEKERCMKIKGAGKDTPMEMDGGLTAKIPYRFDLIPPFAMIAIAEVMSEGLKNHEKNGWKKVPEEKHLNNALAHLLFYMAGDRQDDHLEHALCRIAFLVDIKREKECQKNGEQ